MECKGSESKFETIGNRYQVIYHNVATTIATESFGYPLTALHKSGRVLLMFSPPFHIVRIFTKGTVKLADTLHVR